jgi:hypothetical protein
VESQEKKVLLKQIDGKGPNLALMKISTFHKSKGDEVGFDISDHDRVYISCIFKKNAPQALGIAKMFSCEVEIGGYGVNGKKLPDEIEYLKPDYSLYPNFNYSIGFTSRGCIRKCPWCDVWRKEGYIKEASPISKFLQHQRVFLLDNNLLASPNAIDKLSELASLSTTHRLKVCFNQGLDIRLINDKNAKYLADIDFRSLNFRQRRLYFAWDDLKLCPEKKVIGGIEILNNHGIKPYQMMFLETICQVHKPYTALLGASSSRI